MAIIVAFITPIAVVVVFTAAKSFVKHCKEDNRGRQAIFNK